MGFKTKISLLLAMLHCKSYAMYASLAPWGADSMFRNQRIDYTGPRM